METHVLQISKQARYSSLGEENNPHLLLALHGYGQLSAYFIRNFESLEQKEYHIVAPEGPHRFYLQGSSGRVGASWMTKEWREQDIEENVLYLERLLEELTRKREYSTITLLGFSQGGATAVRWMARTRFPVDRLVLWACVFPEDVVPEFASPKFQMAEKVFVLGDEDEYFEGSKAREMMAFYADNAFRVINFNGKHKIDLNALHLLFKKSDEEI